MTDSSTTGPVRSGIRGQFSNAGLLPERLRLRADMLHVLRLHFRDHGFLDVETPTRVAAPALEAYIDAEPSGDHWLRTSPELHMKRLLAAGIDRLFQIGPCFRRGEKGHRHLGEFTMLEWYRADADWRDVLEDAQALVRKVVRAVHGDSRFLYCGSLIDVDTPWEEITVEDAFRKYAQANLDECIRAGSYEEVLVTAIEPHLGVRRPTLLTEYPAAETGLAKTMHDNPGRAERWELYIAGIELANACSELVDAPEQRRRFEVCARNRAAAGRDVYPLDESFLRALADGVPPCAGVALGIDRLVMLLADVPDIQHAVAFPPDL